MNGTRRTVILVGLALVAGASVLGYWFGERVEDRSSPSPAPTDTPTPSPEATQPPEESAPSPSSSPMRPATRARKPAENEGVPLLLTLTSVPASVRSDTPFVVRWDVRGPSGSGGASTRVVARLNGATETAGPRSGSFQLPARFEATLRVTGTGELTIAAEAIVNGQTLHAERRVRTE